MEKNLMGKRLKKLRTKKEKSFMQIQKELGISNQALSYWELGKRMPNSKHLSMLSDYYDVSADYILGKTDNPEINKPINPDNEGVSG